MLIKKYGFVFPGQGSQSVGMLHDIANECNEIEVTFAEASEVLGYNLWDLVAKGPAEELDKTIHTQPALLTASYAIWRILQARNNIKPQLLAGHSLGEYTALLCANAIQFKDAVRIVAARGEYMQEAVPFGQGALAAIIGLDEQIVESICAQAKLSNEVLSPANFNCPGQIVLAGHFAAVNRAIILAKDAGARLAKLLPVSVPSHCILMKPAASKLAELLKNIEIQIPTIPVLNNVDVQIYDSQDAIRDGLIRQLFMPVRWVETIEFFVNYGITNIIECGPGKILSGLNRRIVSNLQFANTADIVNFNNVLSE